MSPRSHLRQAARWFAATLARRWLRAAGLVWRQLYHRRLVFLTLVSCLRLGGIWLALYVALLCAVSFDYYFLPPFRSLQITGIEAWLAMISFMLSCAVVGRVAERARRQARQAERRREDVERLYTLSQEMMLQEDAAGLIRDLPA